MIIKYLKQSYKHLQRQNVWQIICFSTEQQQQQNNGHQNGHKKHLNGPSFKHFLLGSQQQQQQINKPFIMKWDNEPYIEPELLSGRNSKVFIKTYGCQMNVNDSEIASSILKQYDYKIVDNLNDADIVLLMTCAIRENAENKVWSKLFELNKAKQNGQIKKFGLLGCMAERLKAKILQQLPSIDVVAGPDSYRLLPKLLAINSLNGQSAINVLLSIDETYDNIIPSKNQTSQMYSSFVSITRGCDNMCTYCIVPYTRGRERSRKIDSILEECQHRIQNGVREIILLGQNVNSYRDFSNDKNSDHKCNNNNDDGDKNSSSRLADGFKTIYRLKPGGIGFEELLKHVAQLDPNVRIRFQSPHPKDFNESVLSVISQYPNIAKGLHLPVQSGSNRILEKMRRGYTREAYLQLVERIRYHIPDCGFSSDFICGFCDETDDDHRQTIDIIEKVGYYIAYIFAYSMRDKTYAYHHFEDNVSQSIKIKRLIELNEVYRRKSKQMNEELVGKKQLILIENLSKKSTEEYYGRNESNQKVVIPKIDDYQIGDFVSVEITDCTPVTLIGKPNGKTSITEFYSSKSKE